MMGGQISDPTLLVTGEQETEVVALATARG